MAALPPGPGWYPDPLGPPGQMRWWDGHRWGTQSANGPPGGGAYVLSACFPIVGFIWAIVCFSRSQIGPAFGLIGAGLLGFLIYLIVVGI